MSGSDTWLPDDPLARYLGNDARQLGASLCLERHNRAIALIATARDRSARLRSALAARADIEFPPPGGVTTSAQMTIVSAGPAEYLAVSANDYVPTFAEDLQLRLASLATVTDYSDHLVQLALSGAGTMDVMARLCSMDFQALDRVESFAAVARVGLLRAHLWRAAPTAPLTLAVQRTYAVSFLDTLLRAADAVARQ